MVKPFSKIAAAAVVVALLIIVTTLPGQVDAQEATNHAPELGAPSSTSLYYLFPRGVSAKLEFSSEPASDADDDPITYAVTFKFDGSDATETAKTPDQMLLTVDYDPTTFDFTIEKSSNYSVSAYRDIYNTNGAKVILHGTLTANDGAESDTTSFSLTVQHDASAEFGSPAVYQGDNRWQVSKAYETYEGPSAAREITQQWQASADGSSRIWRPGLTVDSPVSCYDGAGDATTVISSLWRESEDDALFTVTNTPDTTGTIPTGNINVAFLNDNPDGTPNADNVVENVRRFPDYENPHDADSDNVYHLRIVNGHEITTPDPANRDIGCDGSAVDIAITVKDVGPPAPIEDFIITLKETDDGYTVNMRWDNTRLNRFIENGDYVDFPDPYFHPTVTKMEYLIERQTPTSLTHTGETEFDASINRYAEITGLPDTKYTFTLTTQNSEGTSDPVTQTIRISGLIEGPAQPTVSPAGPTSLAVSWTDHPREDLTITGYDIQFRKIDATDWIPWDNPSLAGTSETITTLTPNQEYEVQVRANTTDGNSDWSESQKATTNAFLGFAHFRPRRRVNLQVGGTGQPGLSIYPVLRRTVKNPPTPAASGGVPT